MRVLAVLLSALFLLAQPAWATGTNETSQEHVHDEDEDHDHQRDEHADHKSSANGVTALHAWIQATSDKNALMFVEIENGSEKDVRIVGARTEIADKVALVGFQLTDGEADYVVLPAVPVKPGKELILAPNGLALRLTGLQQTLEEGDTFEIELQFDFGHLGMVAQVEATNATQHSHAGHQH